MDLVAARSLNIGISIENLKEKIAKLKVDGGCPNRLKPGNTLDNVWYLKV